MPFSFIEPWQHWCSRDYPPKQQYEAWRVALNESYLEWDLCKPASPQFYGEIEMRNMGGIRLLHCQTDPCHGKRTKNEIKKSEEAYFGLLLIYEGHELVRCADKEASIGNSGCVLWDSTRPIEFAVTAELKKSNLIDSARPIAGPLSSCRPFCRRDHRHEPRIRRCHGSPYHLPGPRSKPP